MKKLILIVLMFLALINLASAVVVYGEFENGLSSTIINRNQETTFNSVIFSNNPPINYNVRMYNDNGDLIKTFVDTITNNNYVSNRFSVTRNDYQIGGIFTITINAVDSLNDNDLTSLSLQVINNAPILNPIGNKVINENELLQFTITATDSENDELTFRAENLPQDAIFTDNLDNTASFSWQTDYFDAGIYNVRFVVSDSQFEDSEEIQITVINVPVSPSIQILAPRQNEVISGIYEVRWTAADIDQTEATLDIKLDYSYNGYDWITLEDLQDNNDGSFIWDTTQLSDANDYVLRAIVTDDDGNQAQDLVTFAIDNPFTPNINIIRPVENEIISGSYNILWQANDLDQVADTLDIKLEYRDPAGNFISRILNIVGLNLQLQQWIILEDAQDNNDGIFTWQTTQIANGNYELRATVTDNDGNTATDYVSNFIINNIIITNNPPVITSTPITLAFVNQQYNYDVEAFDPDNDPLTYSLITNPSGMSIDANTGLITWLPSQVGFYNVVVSVSDSQLSATQSFVIEVRDIIITPTAKKFASHKIQVSNVILTYDNNLNVFTNIKNQGNKTEDIKIVTTIMNNGMHKEEKVKLNVNQGTWKLTEFNLPKENYVVKVEIISKQDRDVKYAYIN